MDVMLAEFIHNCDPRLAGRDVRGGESMIGLAVLWSILEARSGRRNYPPDHA